jgi:hypothetical protein
MAPDAEPTCTRENMPDVCKLLLGELKKTTNTILGLLRGVGDDPGIVGRVRSHADSIDDVRRTLYGPDGSDGLVDAVHELKTTGTHRAEVERERRALVYSVVGKLLTAAILALIALIFSIYKWGGPPPRAPQSDQAEVEVVTDKP